MEELQANNLLLSGEAQSARRSQEHSDRALSRRDNELRDELAATATQFLHETNLAHRQVADVRRYEGEVIDAQRLLRQQEGRIGQLEQECRGLDSELRSWERWQTEEYIPGSDYEEFYGEEDESQEPGGLC